MVKRAGAGDVGDEGEDATVSDLESDDVDIASDSLEYLLS